MKTGTVAHLFYGHEILLVLRDSHEDVIDAGCWDSITETMEVEDCENFVTCMKRGLIEEICISPSTLYFLGLTRAGHGFFVGFLSDEEMATLKLGSEGQKLATFTLADARRLKLGGALKYHLEAYPNVFEKMSKGTIPEPEELRLSVLMPK